MPLLPAGSSCTGLVRPPPPCGYDPWRVDPLPRPAPRIFSTNGRNRSPWFRGRRGRASVACPWWIGGWISASWNALLVTPACLALLARGPHHTSDGSEVVRSGAGEFLLRELADAAPANTEENGSVRDTNALGSKILHDVSSLPGGGDLSLLRGRCRLAGFA